MAARTDRSARRAKRAVLPTPQPEVAYAKPRESAAGTKTADEASKGKKKAKAVRDTFTMPEPEYALIRELKKRCLGLGVAVKKSQILRAGIAMLAGLSDDRLTQAVTSVAGIGESRLPGKKNER
jgi:hypothetical protein